MSHYFWNKLFTFNILNNRKNFTIFKDKSRFCTISTVCLYFVEKTIVQNIGGATDWTQ